ncbi:CLUMA_CG017329, isoform A [Clunio marinus]|uniref:CLUMA_CG017329, isoform A n=1 Tax=Clunio marinus TaxID=568069 RepID=A0A1J1IVU3_9DIPT|nr:CLUMA_CG017329, isoform A [Clunio marinus]
MTKRFVKSRKKGKNGRLDNLRENEKIYAESTALQYSLWFQLIYHLIQLSFRFQLLPLFLHHHNTTRPQLELESSFYPLQNGSNNRKRNKIGNSPEMMKPIPAAK